MTAAPSSIRNSFMRHLLVLTVLLGSTLCGPRAFSGEDGSSAPTGFPTALGLQGDPLRVWTDQLLRTWVYRNQPNVEVPVNFIPQYFDYYRTTLVATNGVFTEVYGEHRPPGQYSFTAVDGTHVMLLGDPSTAITATVRTDYVDLADTNYLEIAHTITAETDASIIRHEWTVTNVGSESYTGVALRYGGDTHHGGYDNARGSYPATSAARASKLLYCSNYYPDETGLMGMEGAAGTGFTGVIGYMEGFYSSVETALDTANDLPDAVNVDKATQGFPDLYADNGMAIEWRYSGTLAPGHSFTVVLYERWTQPGTLQVIAPADFTAEAGTQETVDFLVINLGSTVELTAIINAPEGWLTNATLPESPIAPDSVNVATYEIAIPPNTSSGGTLELQVKDSLFPLSLYQSDSVEVTVIPMTITLPRGADLPLSTNDTTIYTAVSPATYEGVSSLMNALDGRPATVTRAFAWDNSANRYADVTFSPPIQTEGLRAYLPGGVEPETGIFIATRQPLDYDLAGTPLDVAYYSTFQLYVPAGSTEPASGWTFAGIPLLRLDASEVETQFSWYGYDTAGATPVDIYINGLPADDNSMAVVMGDGLTAESSRPWSWNADTNHYEQVSVLTVGKAYWFKNNTTDAEVIIQISGSPVVTLRGTGKAASGTSKYTMSATWRDRGAPPSLPGATGGGSGASGSASSSGGGGCGSGSGIGLFSMLMFLFGLRFLVARR